MKLNKKGAVSLYITLIITTIVVILLAAVFAPMGTLFNTEMYKAGESILLMTNQSISEIQNETAKAQIQAALGGALASGQNNIEVNAAIFQYGWIFVIGIAALVVFLYQRRLVEAGLLDKG